MVGPLLRMIFHAGQDRELHSERKCILNSFKFLQSVLCKADYCQSNLQVANEISGTSLEYLGSLDVSSTDNERTKEFAADLADHAVYACL